MRRNEDSQELGESLEDLTMLTTLIIWKIKESSTHLSQALRQEIKDKQIGLNDELKNINDLTMV